MNLERLARVSGELHRRLLGLLFVLAASAPSDIAAQQLMATMQEELYFRGLSLHASAVRCARIDPALAAIRATVSEAEEVHAADIGAGKEIVRRRFEAAGSRLDRVLARAIAFSARLLRMQREDALRECEEVRDNARALAGSRRNRHAGPVPCIGEGDHGHGECSQSADAQAHRAGKRRWRLRHGTPEWLSVTD